MHDAKVQSMAKNLQAGTADDNAGLESLIIDPVKLYPHVVLQKVCGLRTDRAFKDFVAEYEIPHFAIQGRWLIRGQAFIDALAKHEMTVAQRRALKTEASE